MYRVLRTVLGSKDKNYYDIVRAFFDKTNVWMSQAIRDSFAFVLKFYDEFGMFPTMSKYNEILHQTDLFLGQEPLGSLDELKCHLKTKEVDLCHAYQYTQAMTYLATVSREGLKAPVIEALRNLSEINTEKEEVQPFRYKDYVLERKSKGTGYHLFLSELELEDIHGEKQYRFTAFEKGLITTIAGFTGQYKTTLALNSALKIIMEGGNVYYISLEVPKKDILLNLYSLYSITTKGQKLLNEHLSEEDVLTISVNDNSIVYKGLDVRKLRNCQYSDTVLNFISYVLEPEFNKDILPHIFICDETDINNDFSEISIRSRLIQADDTCRSFKGTKSVLGNDFSDTLDLVYVDHVGLTKFYRNLTERLNYTNVGDTVNMYAAMFRRICVNFRTVQLSDGSTEQRQLAGVLLAQINREGWKFATRSKTSSEQTVADNKGTYDLTCLAEANELEKGSAVVITVYTDDDLRASHWAKVQCLKARFGKPVNTPVKIVAIPEFYLIGGINGEEATPFRTDIQEGEDFINMTSAIQEGVFSNNDSLLGDLL